LIGKLEPTGFTTPDAPRLQRLLWELKQAGAKSVAIEVSSHALDQGRVLGTSFDTVVMTNLTQDHLDYHGSLEEYGEVKKKILDLSGISQVILNIDDPFVRSCISAALARNTSVWLYSVADSCPIDVDLGESFHLLQAKEFELHSAGLEFSLFIDKNHAGRVKTGFVGEFNAGNALAVFAKLLANGLTLDQAKRKIERLKPVVGRLELLQAKSIQMPLAIVDFAHTPDALEKVLQVIRPLAEARGGKVSCVFGCGGDRDPMKRPMMGRVAEQLADVVTVTSDNPRSEDPQAIIDQILAGMKSPGQVVVNVDRATAILQAIRSAQPQDVVLIAGKGHEQTQEIAGKRLPFSDQLHVELAMGGLQ
jgi:UDP-N-acetylmuramoyl-L-alanyl-D-glutamate--2,6-diaminopimelate ligase